MPRNGSGQFVPLTNSWYPPVNGVLATADDFKSQWDDVVAGLTQSVSADGQTPMTGNLPMGGNQFTNLGAPTGNGQGLRWEQITRGADIASSATITIPNEGSLFNVTGTTTITSIADCFPGRIVQLEFVGALTLTNSASLVLPFGKDYKTQAGDIFEFVNDAPGIWTCIRLPARISPGRLIAVRVFSTAGTTTYDPTDGTRAVLVEVQGGGAAGGGTPVTGSGQAAVGGGGGAGGYAASFLTSGFSGGVTITVGAAGAPAVASVGGAGGTSSFGNLLSATGGSGGPGGAATVTPPWLTGGGTGGTGVGGNIINKFGGQGGSSFALSTGSALQGGAGGFSHMGGAGGPVSGGNAFGNPAATWGAGGSGVAMGQGQAAVNGGSGFRGIVIVWEFA